MGPKAGFYSPLACANCHTDVGENLSEVYRTPPSLVQIPDITKITDLPSPSDCPAEIFWPPPLTSYSDFVQKNPFLRSQNYLTTLAASRRGQFPARFSDSSLATYVGLKGGAAFPFEVGPLSFQIARDAEICAGPVKADGCEGWAIDVQDDDFGIVLPNRNWISAKDLEVEATGFSGKLLTGVKVDGIGLRDGKLIATFGVANPLVNSTVPWFTDKVTPNPFSADLYDFDLTPIILAKIPVAYDPDTRRPLTWQELQDNPQKKNLQILPYFHQWARTGRLPERISINRLYESVSELLAHTDRAEPSGGTDWSRFLGGIRLHGKVRPESIVHPKVFAEFSPEVDKNQIEVNLEMSGPGLSKAYVYAPLHLSRLLLPGLVDILDLQGRLEIVAGEKGDMQIALHDLDMEIGRIDFGGSADGPGKAAISGGRIGQGPILDPLLLTPEPAVKIEGNPEDGYEIRLNMTVTDLKVKLPMVGEVALSGNLNGRIHIVAEQTWISQTDGGQTWGRRYRLDPENFEVRLENGSLAKTGGWSAEDFTMDIGGMRNGLVLSADQALSFLTLALDFPKIIGSPFTSAQLAGGITLPETNGGYDFAAFLRNPESSWQFTAQRADGQREDWNLAWNGKTAGGVQKHDVAFHAERTKLADGTKTSLVDGFQAHIEKENLLSGYRVSLDAAAKNLDLGALHLTAPKLKLGWEQEDFGLGILRLTVPVFELTANSAGTSRRISEGWIRGPLWIKDKAGSRHPLTFSWNRNSQVLDVKNMRFGIGAQSITPPTLRSATKGKLSSVDIDGMLKADWSMDLAQGRGKGSIQLLGDGEGDIHLRDEKGLRLAKPDPRDPAYLVETPMFAKTSWTLTSISGIDAKGQRILGDFRLETEIDPAIARSFGIIVDSGKVVSWKMRHDHLPYTPKGFFLKMSDYLAAKLREERRGGDAP